MVITPKKISYEKMKCQISQNDVLQMKFSEYYLFFTIPVKFEIYVLGRPKEIVFDVVTDN